jgi:beta-galactosidase
MKTTLLSLLALTLLACAGPALKAQSFTFSGDQFILNGKPFQILAGEIHPQRIPHQYWEDRLLKLKAAGLNTVGCYVFWNAFEPRPGEWDFTGNNNIREFLQLAQKTGLHVLLRPGPYACAEWDFGGLPAWLLTIPDIKVRCSDPRFMQAVEKYFTRLYKETGDLQITRGGPVIMVQIENEYGSFGNDKPYLLALKELWIRLGITIPFYTADGATPYMLEAGMVPGGAIGLDPGTRDADFAEAAKIAPGVPSFCSEIYPGWLTHWGEKWATVDTGDILPDLRWLLEHKKSFSLYMFHGGTNFGWMAGANFSDKYEPDLTSYDYDAPLNEMGQPTPKYFAIRDLIRKHLPEKTNLPALPEPLPVITLPAITFTQAASLFDNLPEPVASAQPAPMESFGQYYGFILYSNQLVGHHTGKLQITDLHDYANIYTDGKYTGTLDRGKKEKTRVVYNDRNVGEIDKGVMQSLELPKGRNEKIDILVEGMGRINYGQLLIDRKGITDRVTLNGMTLMNWKVYNLPMDEPWLKTLKWTGNLTGTVPGMFYRAVFNVEKTGDTYLDMSGWKKGVVWVNGHNLGRYWETGPQTRLFLPATFLVKGENEIIIFDLHMTSPATVTGTTGLK